MDGKNQIGGNFVDSIHSHINETATFGEITDEITKDIGSKTIRHEKFKAHKQKLYKDAIMWKQIVKSERIIDNSEKEANLSRLMTISEESEKEDEEEIHNKTKNNVEIHLKTKEGITSSSRYHETKPTERKVDRMKEASIRTTEDKYSKQTKIGTSYVNGQEVFATFDSCSSITVVHHGIIIKTDEAENKTTDDENQDYKMLWRTL